MELRKKRAIMFSTDAIIAILLLFAVILIAVPLRDSLVQPARIHYDVLKSLSSLHIKEVHNPYVDSLRVQGLITNENNTILEQLGEFYVTNTTLARRLAAEMLIDINESENIGIWYGATLIISKNKTPFETADRVEVTKAVISGLQEGGSVTGYSARASLENTLQKKYEYFGGYIGDGNITKLMYYLGNITSASLEIAINENFSVYINGNYAGTFNKSPSEFVPAKYNLSTANFSSGINNRIEIRGKNPHIAGGFVRIEYQSEPVFNESTMYRFPGIEGLINIYDGFYIPGPLQNMSIQLHFNVNQTPLFLTIGNKTVYNTSANGERNITINNSYLATLLNYSELSAKTIPLRLGLENVSFLGNFTGNVDVFSVTDLSGSMEGAPLTNAKAANNILIDAILNISGDRVGLAGYNTTASDYDYHYLSNNTQSLKNKVAGWDSAGYTCICCGINKAINGFLQSMGLTNSGSKGPLVAYYKFNNNPNDSSGNALHGTLVGGATYSAGVQNNAIELDGSGDYIRVNNNQKLNFGGGSFTIAAWIRPDSLVARRIIIDKANATQGYRFMISDSDSDRLKFIRGAAYGDGVQSNNNALSSGSWQHVAAVVNTSGETDIVTFYVNAVQRGSGTLAEYPASSNANFTIGHKSYSGSSAVDFDGRIDEVRLYARALTQTEIQSLADQTPSCSNSLVEVGEVCDGEQQLCTNNSFNGVQQCLAGCGGFSSCNVSANCGNRIVNFNETCDDGNNITGDGCSQYCQLESRYRSMIVMSDGEANRECAEQGTGDAKKDAVEGACTAWEDYGITVNAVGFGDDADETTLQNIAYCGNGSYYYANVNELAQIYQDIANAILAQFTEQTVHVEGRNVFTRLFEDSFIQFEYNKSNSPTGLLIKQEYPFQSNSSGTYFIPSGAQVVETRLASYSGPRWTDTVTVDHSPIYRLSNYGSNYIHFGDPFIINIPSTNSTPGTTHLVNVTTAVTVSNKSAGSIANKIIATFVRNITSFSPIVAKAEGCNWFIQFDDLTNITAPVPSSYMGADHCSFASSTGEVLANENDAIQLATLSLLRLLDTNNNTNVDTPFTSEALDIATTEIAGIPFTWSTEVQIRRWR